MSRQLNVFYKSERVGVLLEDENERFSFEYDDSWLNNPNNFSLSLALGLERKSYGHLQTKSFFENLLPESGIRSEFLKMLGRDDNDFNFLKQYGQECAGALSIVEGSAPVRESRTRLQEVPLGDIESYLEARKPLITVIIRQHEGKFSLAGAQDKFAAIYRRKRIWIPIDGRPTTHIIKPPMPSHLDSPYNEYFCMKLAKWAGLDVPRVDVIPGMFPLYVVKRFDRENLDGDWERINQQDFCQAQGLTSQKKYEQEGGPGLKDHCRIIKNHSDKAGQGIDSLLRWMWFNILIGNNDCHAKNLALVNIPSGWVLSPFYDLLSTTIYPEYGKRFSYSIGGNWNWETFKSKNFEILAKECELLPAALFKIGSDVIKRMSKHIEKEVGRFGEQFDGVDTADKIRQEFEKRRNHLCGRIGELRV